MPIPDGVSILVSTTWRDGHAWILLETRPKSNSVGWWYSIHTSNNIANVVSLISIDITNNIINIQITNSINEYCEYYEYAIFPWSYPQYSLWPSGNKNFLSSKLYARGAISRNHRTSSFHLWMELKGIWNWYPPGNSMVCKLENDHLSSEFSQ